jgi:hypothetical protein
MNDAYRLAQTQKLIDLFTGARGKPPQTPDELNAWLESPEGKALTAIFNSKNGREDEEAASHLAPFLLCRGGNFD